MFLFVFVDNSIMINENKIPSDSMNHIDCTDTKYFEILKKYFDSDVVINRCNVPVKVDWLSRFNYSIQPYQIPIEDISKKDYPTLKTEYKKREIMSFSIAQVPSGQNPSVNIVVGNPNYIETAKKIAEELESIGACTMIYDSKKKKTIFPSIVAC